jgi:hypothetical protein
VAPWLLAGLVIAGAGLAAPAVVRRVRRRSRRGVILGGDGSTAGRAVEATWDEVLDTATDFALGPHPAETTRDLAQRLRHDAALTGESASALRRLASAIEQVRYSPVAARATTTTGGEGIGRDLARDLARDLDLVVAGIKESSTSRERREALVWPASGRAAIAGWWAGVTARTDRLSGQLTAVARRG